MIINLTLSELEVVEKSLRFFFCHNDDEKNEDKSNKAFDLALEFENLIERNYGEDYEISICH